MFGVNPCHSVAYALVLAHSLCYGTSPCYGVSPCHGVSPRLFTQILLKSLGAETETKKQGVDTPVVVMFVIIKMISLYFTLTLPCYKP